MKINLIKRKLIKAVAFATAFFMALSPLRVFAQVDETGARCSCAIKCTSEDINNNCKVCAYDYTKCEGVNLSKDKDEHYGPLTPDGNLTLVDDYGTLEAGGKQFITVVTKQGNYFYIIIDRDDEGHEIVHFLNMVDESDLFSLMNEEQVKEYIAKVKLKEPSPTPIVTEVVKEVEVPIEPVKEEKKSTSPMIVLILLMMLGGGAAYLYLKKMNENKQDIDIVDPDADYVEGDDFDYEIDEDKIDEEKMEYFDEEDDIEDLDKLDDYEGIDEEDDE